MSSLRPALAVLTVAIAVLSLPAVPAAGQGFIVVETQVVVTPEPVRPPSADRVIPPPRQAQFPLEVKNQVVTCAIRDTVATTRVEQVFHNRNARPIEGTYMLPLPETASVQRFSLWMDGKEVKGELLDADKARQTYEEIVRRTRDPGLLEYVGGRLYRARVFPIPANGDVRIALEYTETLTVSAGLGTYRYGLNTQKHSLSPVQDVTITVDIASQLPIKSVFCPSHPATVSRPGEKQARVGFEARQMAPDRDFVVHFLMSEAEFGLSLLTYRPPGEDGYFLARLAPPFTVRGGQVLAKDVCFVMDTSGSMAGDKIAQARKALAYCISSLHKEDRFNLITFATDVRPFRGSLIEATPENLAAARAEVEKIEAAGGTSIDEALKTALQTDAPRSGDRPFMIIFITDGEPTVGERDPDRILANVKQANQGKSRIFVCGVGHDLNTRLLDRLADDNRGAREYITEKEDIEVKVSSLFAKLSNPVLSDIELKFTGADTYDVYPKTWPDLFHGSELTVIGRYRRAGNHGITLTGRRGRESMTWRFDGAFGESTSGSDFLPRLWATRKIGYLMDEIRLHGETRELKDEIVSLARRHAIITPYTSYLVIEDTPGNVPGSPVAGAPLQRMLREDRSFERSELRGRFGGGFGYGGQGAYKGDRAVEASKEAYALRGGDALAARAPAARAGQASPADRLDPEALDEGVAGKPAGQFRQQIRQLAGKTFYLDQGRWIDSQFDGKTETRKIKAFSDEYFALLKQNAALGKYLSLGERIIVVLNGTAYEIQ
ncbi:MAG: VWA domain-containing protein [Phycisphaerae bacterium]|jgi:Ca-activated chloride channel family protein